MGRNGKKDERCGECVFLFDTGLQGTHSYSCVSGRENPYPDKDACGGFVKGDVTIEEFGDIAKHIRL